jgi:hypothetical protein
MLGFNLQDREVRKRGKVVVSFATVEKKRFGALATEKSL